jgi:hypothetical protein
MRNVFVKDCVFDDNYRQAFSISGGMHNLLVEDTILSNTGANKAVTAPGCGLDIEPDGGRCSDLGSCLRNITFRRVKALDNLACGFSFSLQHMANGQGRYPNGSLIEKAHVDFLCEDCVVDQRSQFPSTGLRDVGGVFLSMAGEPGLTGTIDFVRLVVIGGTSPAVNALAAGTETKVSFRDSLFVNNSVMPGFTGAGPRVSWDPTDWYPPAGSPLSGKQCEPHHGTASHKCPNPNSVINLQPLWGYPGKEFEYRYGGLSFQNVSVYYPNAYCNATARAGFCMPPLSLLPCE